MNRQNYNKKYTVIYSKKHLSIKRPRTQSTTKPKLKIISLPTSTYRVNIFGYFNTIQNLFICQSCQNHAIIFWIKLSKLSTAQLRV